MKQWNSSPLYLHGPTRPRLMIQVALGLGGAVNLRAHSFHFFSCVSHVRPD